jgi:hypothetical protein
MLPSTGASADLGMLYALALITTVAHVHFGTCVVCASYLNIYAINSMKPEIHLNNISKFISYLRKQTASPLQIPVV